MEENIEIKLVSEKEMYERNPFLQFKLIDNPFMEEPHPRNSTLWALKRGVTKNMAIQLLKSLYTEEAISKIYELLDEGVSHFIVGFESGKGYIKAERMDKGVEE